MVLKKKREEKEIGINSNVFPNLCDCVILFPPDQLEENFISVTIMYYIKCKFSTF